MARLLLEPTPFFNRGNCELRSLRQRQYLFALATDALGPYSDCKSTNTRCTAGDLMGLWNRAQIQDAPRQCIPFSELFLAELECLQKAEAIQPSGVQIK